MIEAKSEGFVVVAFALFPCEKEDCAVELQLEQAGAFPPSFGHRPGTKTQTGLDFQIESMWRLKGFEKKFQNYLRNFEFQTTLY